MNPCHFRKASGKPFYAIYRKTLSAKRSGTKERHDVSYVTAMVGKKALLGTKQH